MHAYKVALITGSGTGIGANVAIDLVTQGFTVIVTGRNQKQLDQVVQRCNEAASCFDASRVVTPLHTDRGTTAAAAFVADMYDMDQVDSLLAFIETQYGRLDLLVNNACWRGDAKDILAQGAYDDLLNVMHINVNIPLYLVHKGLVKLNQHRWVHMKTPIDRSSRPVVINISSIAAFMVVPLHMYSISKACMSEASRQLSQLSDQLGIISISISPGPVLTQERPQHINMSHLTLMNRVGTTQEVSNFIMYAINNAPLFNGADLVIDGGYTSKCIDYRKQTTSNMSDLTDARLCK